VGEKKLREFGAAFLGEIAFHLQEHPRQMFADDSFAAPPPAPARGSLGDSARETLRLFHAGSTVAEIARSRDVTTSTIYGHLAEAIERGEPLAADASTVTALPRSPPCTRRWAARWITGGCGCSGRW